MAATSASLSAPRDLTAARVFCRNEGLSPASSCAHQSSGERDGNLDSMQT